MYGVQVNLFNKILIVCTLHVLFKVLKIQHLLV